jgi:hypothetical protein
MNVWEEVWGAVPAEVDDYKTDDVVYGDRVIFPDQREAHFADVSACYSSRSDTAPTFLSEEIDGHRAKLAAAAPELVRALLAAEWGGSCMSYGTHCPACHEYPWDNGGRGEVHKPDCVIDAALRKAGVPRPSPQSGGSKP